MPKKKIEIINIIGYILLILLLVIIFILFIYYKNPISKAVNDSIITTNFEPLKIIIYDKTYEKNCNRYIIIKPFNWYFFVLNNKTYALDYDSGYNCPANTSPGIHIHKSDIFKVVCLEINRESLESYFITNNLKIEKKFTINSEKFTIADCLNLLIENKLIPIEDAEDKEFSPLLYNTKIIKNIYTNKSLYNIIPDKIKRELKNIIKHNKLN